MKCPHHKTETLHKSPWTPPDGIDPRMVKLVCSQCSDYWYKAPKFKLSRTYDTQRAN